MKELKDLPNVAGFNFMAIYKDGTQKMQKVVLKDGLHTTENFNDLIGWMHI